jgi:hypothetical protein
LKGALNTINQTYFAQCTVLCNHTLLPLQSTYTPLYTYSTRHPAHNTFTTFYSNYTTLTLLHVQYNPTLLLLIIPPLIEWGLYCNHLVRLSVRSHFRNRYLSFYWKKWFDIWLWHGDLYRVSPFQVYCTTTSCLQCDLEFFMFAVMKIFVTVISASTGRNDLIYGFDMVTCTVSPLPRFTAHLLPVYSAT